MGKKMIIGVFIVLSALQVQTSELASPNQTQTWGQWLKNYFKRPDQAEIEKQYVGVIRDNILKYIEQNNNRKKLKDRYDKEYKHLLRSRNDKNKKPDEYSNKISIELTNKEIDRLLAQESILSMRDTLFASVVSSVVKKITDSYYLLYWDVYPNHFTEENEKKSTIKVKNFDKTIDDMFEFFKESIKEEDFFPKIKQELKAKKTDKFFTSSMPKGIEKDEKGYITIERVWNYRLDKSKNISENASS